MSQTILLTATGSAGDVHPLIVVGIELKRLGQRPHSFTMGALAPWPRRWRQAFRSWCGPSPMTSQTTRAG